MQAFPFLEPGNLVQKRELRKANEKATRSIFIGAHKENYCDIINNILGNRLQNTYVTYFLHSSSPYQLIALYHHMIQWK